MSVRLLRAGEPRRRAEARVDSDGRLEASRGIVVRAAYRGQDAEVVRRGAHANSGVPDDYDTIGIRPKQLTEGRGPRRVTEIATDLREERESSQPCRVAWQGLKVVKCERFDQLVCLLAVVKLRVRGCEDGAPRWYGAVPVDRGVDRSEDLVGAAL